LPASRRGWWTTPARRWRWNTVGHLLVKGETTAPYYWNRLERTRRTMQGEWLRTGDMFRRDADGWFYFEGRSDDMLKVGGQWVSPAEIEAHLSAHPAVLEAGVIGRPDPRGLTEPCAYVVLKAAARRRPRWRPSCASSCVRARPASRRRRPWSSWPTCPGPPPQAPALPPARWRAARREGARGKRLQGLRDVKASRQYFDAVLARKSGPEYEEVVAITAKYTGAAPDLIRKGFPTRTATAA